MGGFRNDGVGHTVGTATHLPMTGNTVNYTTAKGVIAPASARPTRSRWVRRITRRTTGRSSPSAARPR
ncbi:MAG: hypothetical protein QM754_10625 [Tepidisphaeraceae bacterium]